MLNFIDRHPEIPFSEFRALHPDAELDLILDTYEEVDHDALDLELQSDFIDRVTLYIENCN